jgi:hypothetical protein
MFSMSVLGSTGIFPAAADSKEDRGHSPLLSQTKESGSVAPEYQFKTECTIYKKGVVIKQIAGEIESKTVKRVRLSGPIGDYINAASTGPFIEEVSFLLGGPEETNIAYTETGDQIILNQTGSYTVRNDAPEAATLINFLNLNCNGAADEPLPDDSNACPSGPDPVSALNPFTAVCTLYPTLCDVPIGEIVGAC